MDQQQRWSAPPLNGAPSAGSSAGAGVDAAVGTSIASARRRRAQQQVYGTWPREHPLPLPEWDECDARALPVGGADDFHTLVHGIEAVLQKVLEVHNYNTVGNFVSLYRGFKASQCLNLVDYFQVYTPPITAAHHTCVGLALELWRDLELKEPVLGQYLYLVSCEESIGLWEEYPGISRQINETKDILEKEHVLLAMRFVIDGRDGVLLCDPGYHVGRVIIVMKDQLAPHTGWFMQTKEPHLQKEYDYEFSKANDDFVQWSERISRNGVQVEEVHSVVYIKKPYLTAVDVTERRNLVYSFRSLLSRTGKGELIAGIYFKVNATTDEFTLFYQDDGKKRLKLNFSEFAHANRINEQMRAIIDKCNAQLNLPDGQLLTSLRLLNTIIADKPFVRQLLDINNCINDMTEE